MNTISPLTKNSTASLEKKIDTKGVVAAYSDYGIDVSAYFKDTEDIQIYKCSETGYRYYYPLNLWGDSRFYEHFQQFDWYYMPWKWEHEITLKYLKQHMSLLEVGCAHGAFIKTVNDQFDLDRAVGLELNETAVTKTEKWEIRNETVQSYAAAHAESFDLVCSFQVLEHIADVNGFIGGKVDCLKKGGILIISVPNNDSFIKVGDNCLNMPPHHMGLWTEQSLRALEKLFPLKVVDIHFEELQEYHVPNYVHAKYYAGYAPLVGKILRKLHKFSGIYQKRLKRISEHRLEITGHTILVAYQKL